MIASCARKDAGNSGNNASQGKQICKPDPTAQYHHGLPHWRPRPHLSVIAAAELQLLQQLAVVLADMEQPITWDGLLPARNTEAADLLCDNGTVQFSRINSCAK